ncbi:MAG: hypothetical protein Q8T09_21845 [Candidatus Melainabacteria bacterium]|nr:hypothetical protein [Candidatus Melainabacteria bacterium]
MSAQSHTNKLLSKLLGRSVSVLSIAVLSSAVILPASATEAKLDSAIAQAVAPEKLEVKPETKAETLSDEQMEKQFALPLDNLEDIGYTLQRVQQQAIDLYVEATRKRRETKVLSKSLVIPHEKLQAEGYYQPLRKAWLVFFVGTMEPLVQLLVHDVHDIEEHLSEVKIVRGKQKQFDQVYAQWRQAITAINRHLDVLTEQIQATSPSNIVVANEARAIDLEIGKAMQLRLKAYDILAEASTANKAN